MRGPSGFLWYKGHAMRAFRSRPSTLTVPSTFVLVVAFAAASGCVPPGNAVPEDSGAASPHASSGPVFIPSLGIMSEVFFDDFERKALTDGGHAPPHTSAHAPSTPPSTPPSTTATGPTPKAEAGAKDAGKSDAQADASAVDAAKEPPKEPPTPVDTSGLGPNWTQAKTSAWRVENGWLCGQGAKNHGVWLNRVLPINARIEFDARSESTEGDLKVEVWGDGQSAATTVSYTNATSYLAIFGGWKNTLHVLARINEHGTDRKELHVDKESDDAWKRPVAQGQSYHFKIERLDGKTVRWFVNGAEMHSFADTQPLQGQGHDHFGFNDWDAKVCFDNVRVTPL